MKRKLNYILILLSLLLFVAWQFANSEKTEENFSENVKVSLRDAGDQLLLANEDSTSLVLPIIRTGISAYQLSFQKELSIEPDSLVSIIKRSLDKASLIEGYIVEVLQCENKEVAYSYRVIEEKNNNIIPCKGRNLPETCYDIKVKFTQEKASIYSKQLFLTLFIITVFILFTNIFYQRKVKAKSAFENSLNITSKFISIGSYKFYENQNKLIKEAIEISLSKKECELLAILAAQPNQVVKRDELTKRVWEDHGVIVGRSLDTYISKLRKKLKEDSSIKITNVHGVGYKLEI